MNTLAKEMRRMFLNAKVITVKMLYEEVVRKYIMKIEEAHQRAGSSTLTFPRRW